MYVPKHFAKTLDDEVYQFIEQNGFGQLISADNDYPEVSFVPFLIDKTRTQIQCHVAKQNPHANLQDGQIVLMSILGSHGYISPSWYRSSGVPTWNFQAVNIYGKVTRFNDKNRLDKLVSDITHKYESQQAEPWSISYPDKMLMAITGLDIEITDVQVKYKLSQNRSEDDVFNVTTQLKRQGNLALADAMEKQHRRF